MAVPSNYTDVPASPYHVRCRDANGFDFGLATEWIRRCRGKHSRCKKSSTAEPRGLHVIDCVKFSIVEHPARSPYVALSYVWGKDFERDDRLRHGRAGLCDFRIPKTIADAMRATRKLGYRYLWSDRYCIPQRDGPDKKAQLAMMDDIFEFAEITIVAAAGDHDDYGLPGLHSRPSHSLMIGNLRLTCSSSSPYRPKSLRDSTWNSRTWTFQEALLSWRVLVFFGNDVYFMCQTFCYDESHPRIPIAGDPGQASLRNFFNASNVDVQGVEDLYRLATTYSFRKLTCDGDALDAFRGILKRSNQRSYWGVPIVVSRKSKREYLDLMWKAAPHISITSTRNEDMPSWSWLSVKGAGRLRSVRDADRRAWTDCVWIPVSTETLNPESYNDQTWELLSHHAARTGDVAMAQESKRLLLKGLVGFVELPANLLTQSPSWDSRNIAVTLSGQGWDRFNHLKAILDFADNHLHEHTRKVNHVESLETFPGTILIFEYPEKSKYFSRGLLLTPSNVPGVHRRFGTAELSKNYWGPPTKTSQSISMSEGRIVIE